MNNYYLLLRSNHAPSLIVTIDKHKISSVSRLDNFYKPEECHSILKSYWKSFV